MGSRQQARPRPPEARCRYVQSMCGIAFFEVDPSGPILLCTEHQAVADVAAEGDLLAFRRVPSIGGLCAGDLFGSLFFNPNTLPGDLDITIDPEWASLINLNRVLSVDRKNGKVLSFLWDSSGEISTWEVDPQNDSFRVAVVS